MSRSLRALPLLAVWCLALWPIGLWLVHGQDPELAVRIAQVAGIVVRDGTFGLLALGALVCLLYPPAPAWLRLAGSQTLLGLTANRAALQKALADLQHFESAARHLDVGRLALQRRETQLAARHLRRSLELDPSVPSAHHLFGHMLFRVGQYSEAAAAFRRARELDPGHAFGDALLHEGRCRFLAGDVAAALPLLQEHERTHGGGRKSHLWLAEALQAAGDGTGATAAYTFAAAPPGKQRLTAEENWFRARARVRLWGRRRTP
jgi:tetratricopeptide (TPR) repeat protein